MSLVRKVKIAGTELEIDPSKIGQFQTAVVESFGELTKKADPLYKEMVEAQLVRVRGAQVPRLFLQMSVSQDLRQRLSHHPAEMLDHVQLAVVLHQFLQIPTIAASGHFQASQTRRC